MKMKNNKYKLEAENLIKVIDTAIKTFKKVSPLHFNEFQTLEVINLHEEWKNDILNAEIKFQNLRSLKYTNEAVFTYFNEGQGECVEEFWKEIRAQNLPYKRENKMVKILKRKKINNIDEYDFVIDVIVPYQQEELINKEEVALLNDLILEFKNRKKK